MTEPTLAQPVVHIIDDDPSVRRALSRFMRLEGWATRTYSSGTDFVESPRPSPPSCIVLDVRLPGIDGIAVQEMLQAEGSKIATVVITANLDRHVGDLARKAGADDFLPSRSTRSRSWKR